MDFSAVNRIFLRRILYAPKDLEPEQSGTLSASAVDHIIDYTNNIVVFQTDGGKLYLKPSRLHQSKRAFLDSCVRIFFSEIHSDDKLKAAVEQCLKSSSCRRKLFRMGAKNKRTPLNRYLTTGDVACLGLPAVDKAQAAGLRKFVFFMYGEINAYNENCGLKKGARQTFGAVRALAVYKLACELGISAVPKTRFVQFACRGREYVGTLIDEGSGINVGSIPPDRRKRRVTPSLLRTLSDLNFLDVLTCDNDRRADNYLTVTDEHGDFVDVCSCDNDGPTVFLPTPSTSVKTVVGYSPLIKNGRINRPHMSRALADSILAFDREKADGYKQFLSGLQLRCFKSRLKVLQKAILKTVKTDPTFLLDDDGWNADCISEELSGSYGKTYLVSFIEDCYRVSGVHPFDMSELPRECESYARLTGDCGYDLSAVEPVMAQLPFGALISMFESRSPFTRYSKLKEWMGELKKAVPSLKLKLTAADHCPYMTDGGLVCLSARELFRPERLLMAVAHESAHILLSASAGYAALKREKNSDDCIEYAADILTLGMLERCREIACDGTRTAIDLLLLPLGTEISVYKQRCDCSGLRCAS